MKILVVGNGGRECSVASALLLSPKVTRLYITPANFGICDPFGRGRVRLQDIPANDIESLLAFAMEEGINLTFVGPEAPLAAGIVNAFREQGLRIVGPDREAARLEAEKSYAKDFMRRYGIPTAASEAFTDFGEASRFLEQVKYPTVIKADGLAAGKGVVICETLEFARETLEQMMVEDVFKGAGKKVLVEQHITGPEISFFCFFDGKTAVMMPPVSDYKRLKDGDKGPNTGGMGCMCPSPYATPALVDEFKKKILAPFMDGCNKEQLDYRGIVYFGTMATPHGMMLLEFNVRLGDPETQALLPLLQDDLVDILVAVESGKLDRAKCNFSNEAAVTIVLASANYPYGSSPPTEIEGLERIVQINDAEEPYPNGTIYRRLPRVSVCYAGVSKSRIFAPESQPGKGVAGAVARALHPGGERDVFIATGGRVLSVTARGRDLSEARRLAYEAAGNIHFTGAHFRTDIALMK